MGAVDVNIGRLMQGQVLAQQVMAAQYAPKWNLTKAGSSITASAQQKAELRSCRADV